MIPTTSGAITMFFVRKNAIIVDQFKASSIENTTNLCLGVFCQNIVQSCELKTELSKKNESVYQECWHSERKVFGDRSERINIKLSASSIPISSNTTDAFGEQESKPSSRWNERQFHLVYEKTSHATSLDLDSCFDHR